MGKGRERQKPCKNEKNDDVYGGLPCQEFPHMPLGGTLDTPGSRLTRN